METKRILQYVFLIGLMMTAGFYFAGTMAGLGVGIANPQPDTLLYCQAARRIAEGHPFSFAAGESVSTGTTSVLYPFILAIPYVLGAKGNALFTAGFLLNALFYLIFSVAWSAAFCRWLADCRTRLVASLLVALAGQPAFCAFAQSDIGIWMAMSAVLAYAFASNRTWLMGGLLVLGPWMRPEGMVTVVAFVIIMAGCGCFRRRIGMSSWVIAGLSVLSVIGVFVFNFWLTGSAQFSSVAHKGYAKLYPMAQAIPLIARDAFRMLRGVVLAIPSAPPREMYSIPLLGGVFFCWGLFSHDWKKEGNVGFWVMLLAGLGGFLTVAQSGWQDTNADRYLAWLMPLISLFVAEGAVGAMDRLKGRTSAILPPLAACVFAAGCAVVFVCTFHCASKKSDRLRAFSAECERRMAPGASVGSFGTCGVAYEFSDRRLRHVGGIYSPEFAMRSDAARYETLRKRPELRFDYWFLDNSDLVEIPAERRDAVLGSVVLAGPDALELRQADWSVFERSEVVAQSPHGDMKLVAEVEIGYDPDEMVVDYEIADRYGRPVSLPFLEFSGEGTNLVFDACRLVLGADRMTVGLMPGRDAVVVMRTKDVVSGSGRRHEFSDPLALNVEIDGRIVSTVTLPLDTNDFCQVSFAISGNEIKNEKTRVGILGDHAVALYQFWQ